MTVDDYHNYIAGSFGHCKCAEKRLELLEREVAALRKELADVSRETEKEATDGE